MFWNVVITIAVSLLVNKIMATYYFKIIDSHIEKTIELIKKNLLS